VPGEPWRGPARPGESPAPRSRVRPWYESCTIDRMAHHLAHRMAADRIAADRIATDDPEIARVRTLARVLDGYFVDPLLGLVLPGIGDVLGSVLGLYVVVVAVRRKVSPLVIARMLLNLGLDAALGAVPLLGDVFDFAFRANRRNLALLTDRVAAGGRPTPRDWLAVGGAAAVFVAIVGLVGWGIVALVRVIA
jgi:hypothetical protein